MTGGQQPICHAGASPLQLEQLLLRFRAADMIANLAFFELVRQQRYHQGEVSIDGGMAIAEYAAQLYWRHSKDASGAVPPPHSAIEQVREHIEVILDRQTDNYCEMVFSDHLDRRLLGRVQLAGLGIRNPGASVLWRPIVSRLMEPLERRLQAQLGFCAADVLKVWGYLGEALPRKLQQHFSRIYDGAGRELFEHLGAAFRFHVDEVAEAVRLAPAVVERVFDRFGLRRGNAVGAPPFPSAHHAYMTRPLLLETSTCALVIFPNQLLWAVLPGIDDALRDTDLRPQYLKRRGDFLEQEVVRLFGRLLGVDAVRHGVKYFSHDGVEKGDIDVFARLDTTAFIIECKAERLRDAARLGAQNSFQKTIKTLLGKAHEQLVRSDSALDDPSVRFEERSRQDCEFVRLPCAERRHLIVTLDHVAALNSASFDFAELGAFEKKAPWTVSLLELTMVGELLETGLELKNYVRRRLEAYEPGAPRVLAIDEMDFLAVYFATGYCVLEQGEHEMLVPGPIVNAITGYFADLNRKPHRNVPPVITELLLRLSGSGNEGWSEMGCDILALHPKNLMNLARNIEQARSNVGFVVTEFQDGSGVGMAYAAVPAKYFEDALVEISRTVLSEQRAENILIVLEADDDIFFTWYTFDRREHATSVREPLGKSLVQRPKSKDIAEQCNRA